LLDEATMSWKDIPGFTDPAMEKFYCEMVRNAPKSGVIVEVGVCVGRSLALLAHEAIVQRRDDLALYGVDAWDAKDWEWARRELGYADTGRPNFFTTALLSLHNHDVAERVRLVRCESVRAARLFDDGSLAAVYLDADHEYEAVKADIAAWGPKVAAGGVLAGHDYGTFAGVTRAVDEAFGKKIQTHGSTWSWEAKP
jgi:Methyltransferase domain